ncbi:MAG: PAS domain S-box protein, partial [Microvirga sp.]
MTAEAQSPALDDGRRLQLLIDAVTDYAIYMLDPAGNVVSWNSGAQKLKGYRPAEIIGQHFSKFFMP